MQGETQEADNLPSSNQPKIVQTDVGAKDGQNKCPKCGATEVSLNVNTGKLRCNFCRYEFEPEQISGMVQDLSALEGDVIGSGAQDIVSDTNDIMTFKCSSCGAEVVIDTNEAVQARCHWCRNILSVNNQIPNGAVPDTVLPFGITKEVAKSEIEAFVGKRKFFAHPKFRAEFTTQNIMGVYFPYMIVDINANASLIGQGEIQTRKYVRKSGNSQHTYYDADLYAVERHFDLLVDGLTVESSADKLNNNASDKTNNIINAIMPFDTENCVKWNANYLKGYTSEKRDTNVEQLKGLVNNQAKDIARHSANETLTQYDRGVAWSNEQLNIKGEQWRSAYLPVWLYSYQQEKSKKNVLHYVAVNARTKETMGSVPIHMIKLLIISSIIEMLSALFWWLVLIDKDYGWLCLLIGIIYFIIIYSKYRNSGARHKYEKETKTQMSNIVKKDSFIQSRKGLTNAKIQGVNNNSIINQSKGDKMLNSLVDNNEVASLIKNKMGSDKK